MDSSDMDSAEIAEDFKDALQDLKINSKPEIDTLTVIARENTAHAQAISSVLEEHIQTVGSLFFSHFSWM
jgi:pre-mRNA cleavage complex 2 protein Pcf11